jgi:hypothetical protein
VSALRARVNRPRGAPRSRCVLRVSRPGRSRAHRHDAFATDPMAPTSRAVGCVTAVYACNYYTRIRRTAIAARGRAHCGGPWCPLGVVVPVGQSSVAVAFFTEAIEAAKESKAARRKVRGKPGKVTKFEGAFVTPLARLPPVTPSVVANLTRMVSCQTGEVRPASLHVAHAPLCIPRP